MECNKDEAVKAKELSEKKFEQKDITGARKLAMKAHNLFPALDGLQPLLATLNVYISAERKINGEVDWYGVLGVDPSSDDETVKRQYRKLALTLHPDKNKSFGAEGAFKILSEAWSLLSDKARRGAYDQKRNSRSIYQKVMPSNPSKVGKNGLHRPADNGNGNFNMSMNSPNPHSVRAAPPTPRNTFWTECTSCKMQFEYVLYYLNKKLECYSCKEPFLAIQIPPPQANIHTQWSRIPAATEGKTFASTPANGPARNPAQAVNGIQLPHLKRAHNDGQVSATLEAVIKSRTNAFKRANAGETNSPYSVKGDKPRKRRRANDQPAWVSEAAGLGSLNVFQRGTGETENMSTATKLPASTRELSLLETRNMLMSKAKVEICKKLDQWKNMASAKASKKEENGNIKEKVSNGVECIGSKHEACAADKHLNTGVNTSSAANSSVDSGCLAIDSAMTVPDPDFHDFDNDRTENSFGDNQVWSAYDDDDGMPRYYAMIHNVISRKPFKMRISWLNSKSTAEFGSMNWVGCGYYKTCGDFRVGKYEVNKSVNSFSHRVKWTKGLRGAIRIYPSKGDVWAVYRNWSPEWNEQTPDEVVHQYDMVEVLNEYNEEKGVTVIPLVKVAGFKTVFRQHMDQKQVRVIPREEMFRFSHRVPSCLLTGQESSTAPRGCWELDPAATPLELLQVISEAPAKTSNDGCDGATNEVKEIKENTVAKTDC